MYNFFVENDNITADKAIIIEDYNHLVNVLRKTIGDKIYVCNKDNGKSYLVEISEITKTEVICNIIEENVSTESNLDITVFLKPASYFSYLRIKCNHDKCINCKKCIKVCPMNVDMLDDSRKRKNGTECILCCECTKVCPKNTLDIK